MQNLLKKIKTFLNKVIHNEYFIAFITLYLTGIIFFGIVVADNDWTLPMTGDYTLQTYAFYSQGYHIFWNFIKTGQYPLFDFSNYLGANYIGTQSFYYVFSPLFYLLCLWPEKYLYQGILFHMIFKYCLGAFFMYILLRKYFHVSKKLSWAGGLAYGLSGWSLYYLWFHFSDVVAVFPLLLMGFERCLKERKGGLLMLSMCFCGLTNYFFLVNFVIFGLFYALYRWIYIYGINKKKGYSAKERWGVLLQGILCCLAGVCMAGICLLPSLHVATSTNRTQSSTAYLTSLLEIFFKDPGKVNYKWVLGEFKTKSEIFSKDNIKALLKILFVWDERVVSSTTTVSAKSNIGYILSNWIFMNTNCWDNILFDNKSLDNSIGGIFITTPLTMLLIPSIARVFKSKRPWAIFGVIVGLIIPFIPFTAHAAFAFTSLYGRWQIWITAVGIIFIIPTLDRFEDSDRKFVTINLLVNYAMAAAVYFISKEAGHLPTDVETFLNQKVNVMYAIAIAELVVMFLMWIVYRFKIFKPTFVKRFAIIVMVAEIGASTAITCEQKGYYNWSQYYLSQPSYQELSEIVSDLQEEDTGFYRVMNTEMNRSSMNLASALNYAGAGMFNSTYDFELDSFINRSKMHYSGSWTMGNNLKRYWLDQYIGTKYYIVDKNDKNNDNKDYYKDLTVDYDGKYQSITEDAQSYNLNLGWNYELYKSYDYYDVYINKNFNGIGYVVDQYILDNILDSRSSSGTLSVSQKPIYYEDLYTDTAIIMADDVDYVSATVTNPVEIKTRSTDYATVSMNKFDLYFSPREDYSYPETGNYDRTTYKLEKSTFTYEEISEILPSYSQFFHKRWEDKGRFGDQLIMEIKEGQTAICPLASKDNQCYVNIDFHMGPKTLISFYNGDTLITQDAHAVTNYSQYSYSTERQSYRGFYLDQPCDKVVIEFVMDAAYDKVFSNSGKGSLNISFAYQYQESIEQQEARISSNLLENVTYKNNKFTFTTNTDGKKIAVTNIPIDDGWTLKANGEEIQTFNVNGGFIGFVTLSGATTYELSYFTPNLKEGLILSGIGLLLFIAIWFVYRKSKSDVLMCENQLALSYYAKQEKEEAEYDRLNKQRWKNFTDKISNLFHKKKNGGKKDGV